MPNFNSVTMIGHLTRDPELRYTPSSLPICEIGLAVTDSFTGQDGTVKKDTCFIDCSCFGKRAETLSKFVKKGDPLLVSGTLKMDSWQTKDGQKRSKHKINISSFTFLGGKQANTASEPKEDKNIDTETEEFDDNLPF